MQQKEKEFWALNGLRFLLGLYIVQYHTLNGHYRFIDESWAQPFLGLGNMATSVFLVLSGFLLTHVYVIDRDGANFNKRNFLVARISSLYPLHLVGFTFALVSLVITIYANGSISVPITTDGQLSRTLGSGELAMAIAVNLALLNAWNPYYLILNTPSWSLSALAFFYFLFPFIAPKLNKVRSTLPWFMSVGILFLLPGIIADVGSRTDVFTDGLLHRNPVIRLPLFISGILLCVLFSRLEASRRTKWNKLLGGVVIFTIILAAYLQSIGIELHVIRNGLYFPAALATVWIAASTRNDAPSKVKDLAKKLGGASLPMFLLHAPLFDLFLKAEKLIRAAAMQAGSPAGLSSIIASTRNMEATLLFYPVYIFPFIYVCILMQQYFVTPMQQGIRKKFQNPGRKVTVNTRARISGADDQPQALLKK